ncbi:MAG: cohesin domain-containing protein, partial [Candidatus Bathyarchaeia archaeon]
MEYAQALKTSLLILLLITLAEQVDADSPAVVGVIPSEVIVQNVGEVFSVNITITNVDNLFGYEVKIFYNSTQLNALWVSLPSNHFLRPSKDDMLYVIKNTTHNAYNATHKFIWFACTLLSPETERSGSGVLLTIYFNATANGGPYPLTPAYPGYTYPAKLSNPEASQIPCTSTPSQITVVPEFPPVDTTPPTISILSPENKTYLVSDVSLTFTVNESTSWIGYSLDNQNNITISGNTTLVNLSDEKYTIKVYANDTAGNMGASEMVYF